MSDQSDEYSQCPICDRPYPSHQIEIHVDRCIFLNSTETDKDKEKKPASSTLKPSFPLFTQKSPVKTLKRPAPQSPPPISKPIKSPRQETPSSSKVKPTTSSNTSVINNNNESEKNIDFTTPLAKQVEPKSLEEFFGQKNVLGEATVLRQLLEKGEVPNMILWGPPGCGKTSLSSVVKEICKNSTKLYFKALCAANCGVKDVEKIVSDAKMQRKFGKQTVLFMDEVHRFNKRQQDVFLLHVEKGDLILIGATTENPSFTINSALLSRCRVIVLEKLDCDSMVKILEKAAKRFDVYVQNKGAPLKENILQIERDALVWLADTCDGDARIGLGNLQMLLQQAQTNKKQGLITVQDIKDGIKKSHLLYDRRGEEHYNIISAMHKSIRGSDVNASLYWTTRMIVSGEDPRFIARRLVRAASEDIGNADPTALQLAVSVFQGCQLIGMPESDVLLAQCAIYLARAPKSREADSALAAAKKTINQCEGLQPSVPMHIRNAPTKLMRELGYGQLERGTKASFMPKGLENVNFFK
ncbi:ATPase WRNIP1-like [Atheta coriaria]|uniref:ATPase WRNIP1-like n=1 Tax=Dalotia coriaria TaxID=877792 RepID=UPI0031F40FD8